MEARLKGMSALGTPIRYLLRSARRPRQRPAEALGEAQVTLAEVLPEPAYEGVLEHRCGTFALVDPIALAGRPKPWVDAHLVVQVAGARLVAGDLLEETHVDGVGEAREPGLEIVDEPPTLEVRERR